MYTMNKTSMKFDENNTQIFNQIKYINCFHFLMVVKSTRIPTPYTVIVITINHHNFIISQLNVSKLYL